MARFSNRPDQWRAAGAAVPSRRLFLQGRHPFSCRYRKNQARYIRYEIQGNLLGACLRNWALLANQHKPIRESSLAEQGRHLSCIQEDSGWWRANRRVVEAVIAVRTLRLLQRQRRGRRKVLVLCVS